MNLDLKKCRKPDCMRKVRYPGYCCGICEQAAGGTYEIRGHTRMCDRRAEQRGECDEYEALVLRQV